MCDKKVNKCKSPRHLFAHRFRGTGQRKNLYVFAKKCNKWFANFFGRKIFDFAIRLNLFANIELVQNKK